MTNAMVKQEIAVAAFKPIYDLSQIETALHDLSDGASEALRSTYEKMLKVGALRFCVKPNRLPSIDALLAESPNFSEPLEDVRKQIALVAETDDRLELMPMLLLGEPGIGKTHFARQLARLIGTGYHYVAMSSLTAGWILSGASSQWKNAKPGKIFDALVNGAYANPLVLIDEIDKAGGDAQYDPLGALYALLEHDTAQSFIDEFAEVPIDASSVLWIATANDMHCIPEPILNRMNVYEIPTPDRDGARRIAQSIYSEIRESHAWGARFPQALEEAPLDVLSTLSPRVMRRAIIHGFGNARLAGRDAVSAHDVVLDRHARRRSIGF
ncbi:MULTISPECIES: AAA family ATPase [Burkholderiaceae]|uniref:AAA family ATPase n=1 Tax=Burkholderiaceae TaxID=119060 RepID=UPI00095B0E78|nr:MULTISPECIES: AAA family ATPase [Burkholderiaceae]MCF2132758.1 AAA family ATPase [Mycetohabitans sp. B3]MCG1017404.1 AAA family ATPase [Mycetohabitans sp. B4]MCG1038208.1 AAA family ATPase [Mycetohabitans sp. B7]SIT70373.1 ATP-dependent Lon protease [Burkholderia sp. b13]SIT76731.1 ATP-dependent Lon protease [Burkholderia sp. b14]